MEVFVIEQVTQCLHGPLRNSSMSWQTLNSVHLLNSNQAKLQLLGFRSKKLRKFNQQETGNLLAVLRFNFAYSSKLFHVYRPSMGNTYFVMETDATGFKGSLKLLYSPEEGRTSLRGNHVWQFAFRAE